MSPKTSKARAGANGGALGNVVCWTAIDDRESTLSATQRQAAYLAARFGLPPARARIVAGLAFDCGRRR